MKEASAQKVHIFWSLLLGGAADPKGQATRKCASRHKVSTERERERDRDREREREIERERHGERQRERERERARIDR